MIKKLVLISFFICTVFSSSYAQLDNSFFDLEKYDNALDSGHLRFDFDNLSYFRNTEYTSLVDKGSTYPGFHLLPYFRYRFHSKAEIAGGLFIRYDIGNPGLKTIEPYFKFKYILWKHHLIFGNLEGSVEHQLIEPMFSYEYAITDRMEHGLQIKYPGKHIYYDFWIDWQKTIYNKDPFNEIFFGGLNLFVNPIVSENTRLRLNGQFMTVHSAGEIDESIEPNTMEYNLAFGLDFRQKLGPNTALFMSGYTTFYEDYSRPLAWGYRDGVGYLGVLRLEHHDYQFALHYWDAYQYQSPLGDQLFHSIGRKNYNRPYDYRKMAGLRIAYEVEIGKNLVFLNRLGVNYNIDHNQADVIMENYLRWHFNLKPKAITLF